MSGEKNHILFYVAGFSLALALGFKDQVVICLLMMLLATLSGCIYAYPYFLNWEKQVQVYWVMTIVLLWAPMVYLGLETIFGWDSNWIPFVLLLFSISMIPILFAYKFYRQVKLYYDIKHYEVVDDQEKGSE